MAELPHWQCHKVVQAARIEAIHPLDAGQALLFFFEPGVDPVTVGLAYMTKHQPTAGGYYVRYADGYESWSPAEAFEAGYTRI